MCISLVIYQLVYAVYAQGSINKTGPMKEFPPKLLRHALVYNARMYIKMS